jgi:two-component system, OmpR family, sensor histidine kinase MprB
VSFRRRITIVSAMAVAIAVVLASLLVYVLTADQLHSQVDNQLRNRAHETNRLKRLFAAANIKVNKDGSASIVLNAPRSFAIAAKEAEGDINPKGAEGERTSTHRGVASRPLYGTPEPLQSGARPGSLFGKLPPNPQQVRGYQQVVEANGRVLARSVPDITLPVDPRTLQLAHKGGEPFFRNVNVSGVHMRVLAAPFGTNRAAELALPLSEVDSLLSRLRLILVLVVIGGIALAALLGRLVAGAAVQPLKHLTQTTEHVALTQDLSGRIDPAGEDEIGRLASSFNAMLDALERSMTALDASVDSQRQLVADASHELRTPVTSLRTNIELLQQLGPQMGAEEHRRVLDEAVEQLEDLTRLINDLIDLARGEEPSAEVEDVRFDILVEEAAQKTRVRAPSTPLQMDLSPAIVEGVPARLERAVGNLIDNALKYSPPEAPVEIALHDKELTVRDHGPGIAAEDLPHIFDRFYRGAEARGRPGSGLGLAIVRLLAAQQGGAVTAEPAPGGGTLMRLRLPGLEPAPVDGELDEELSGVGPAAGATGTPPGNGATGPPGNGATGPPGNGATGTAPGGGRARARNSPGVLP